MEMDFSALVRMYHTQTLVYIGKVKNPFTDEYEININQAKLLMDILNVLKDKSKGNLNVEESLLIDESIKTLKEYYSEQNN